MTYCLGILSKEGIIGLADTRITSGSDTTTAKKIYTVQRPKHTFFIMTSGLRSVRDKAITYFKEVVESQEKTLAGIGESWNESLRASISNLPDSVLHAALNHEERTD
ncbi:MAG: hypothetical protein DHS20C17_31020 [Cyclobacteriaceae bacterium]|nr:MAG: hypothetical protein DHS20C17_31020 [Cyclobacteriaceae bacterium]